MRALAVLALQKPGETFVKHTCYEKLADSVFNLIQYWCTNTPDRWPYTDRLRELALFYSTYVVANLANEIRFLPLLTDRQEAQSMFLLYWKSAPDNAREGRRIFNPGS